MELKGTKEQKKQRLVDLVTAIEREDIIDYFLIFVSGKLSPETRQQDSEREEGGEIREEIIRSLENITRTDALNYLKIIVQDVEEELKGATAENDNVCFNVAEESKKDLPPYVAEIVKKLKTVKNKDILYCVSVFVSDIVKEDAEYEEKN